MFDFIVLLCNSAARAEFFLKIQPETFIIPQSRVMTNYRSNEPFHIGARNDRIPRTHPTECLNTVNTDAPLTVMVHMELVVPLASKCIAPPRALMYQ